MNPKKKIRGKLDAFMEGKLNNVHIKLDHQNNELAEIKATVKKDHEINAQILDLLRSQRDDIGGLKQQLQEVRNSKKYGQVFANKKPLVSVRIATYNRAKILTERTIPSILNQTYQNFEIVIVGDHCTDDTEARIQKLNDKRIRFYNFPQRNVYPNDPQFRWMVAGSPGMNLGATMAKGDWIAPLDDDDEFSKDHIEKLLHLALETQAELATGALIQKNTVTGQENRVWSSPPELNKFSFQGAMYLKLIDFFKYDERSWEMREPGDWNLCRRMLEAGVKVASTKDVVGTMYMVPYDKKKDSK